MRSPRMKYMHVHQCNIHRINACKARSLQGYEHLDTTRSGIIFCSVKSIHLNCTRHHRIACLWILRTHTTLCVLFLRKKSLKSVQHLLPVNNLPGQSQDSSSLYTILRFFQSATQKLKIYWKFEILTKYRGGSFGDFPPKK